MLHGTIGLNMKVNLKVLLLEQVLVTVALVSYLCGFLSMPDVSVSGSSSVSRSSMHKPNERAPFVNKTVLLVIDALRVDHLVTDGTGLMPYCQELLKLGKGIGYLEQTFSPTVTLPRIKSLITGSVPGFMDVVLNFGSGAVSESNLVSFWKQKGLRIHFYGDETWVKLFPKEFAKWESVTSFFVTDYTEVDLNVTRHIQPLLLSKDWDVLILHYLGLDHIGHLDGPNSPLIGPKLREMDDVIRMIHTHLEGQGEDFLMLITGDHGMSNAGGHGGSSLHEVTTSALWASSLLTQDKAGSHTRKSYLQQAKQTDFASTLAIMTGVPIPLGNLGRPLPDVMSVIPIGLDRLDAHYDVSRQLLYELCPCEDSCLKNKDRAKVLELFRRADIFYGDVKENRPIGVTRPDGAALSKVEEMFIECQVRGSLILTENLQSYDMPLLLVSCATIILMAVLALCKEPFATCSQFVSGPRRLVLLLVVVGLTVKETCSFFRCHSQLCTLSSLTFWGILPCLLYCFKRTISFHMLPYASLFPRCTWGHYVSLLIYGGAIAHPVSLLATSFVEEEHQTFYYFLSSIHFLFVLSLMQAKSHFSHEGLRLKVAEDGNCSPMESEIISSQAKSEAGRGKGINGYIRNWVNGLAKRKLKVFGVSQSTLAVVLLLTGSWLLFRLLRTFNSTGDKWRHLPDLNDYLGHHPLLYTPLSILAIILSVVAFCSLDLLFLFFITLGIIARHFVHEPHIEHRTQVAQLTIIAIVFFLFYGFTKGLQDSCLGMSRTRSPSSDILTFSRYGRIALYVEAFFYLLFLLLQRKENILFTCLSLLHMHLFVPLLLYLYRVSVLNRTSLHICALWLAEAHYFCHGNSNSLSTVQVNAGFIGVTSYLPILHGILIALHTFGGKVLPSLHYINALTLEENNFESARRGLYLWWQLRLLTVAVYVVNVTAQRHHLFIWSVFAPKLLYEGMKGVVLLAITLVVWGLQSAAASDT